MKQEVLATHIVVRPCKPRANGSVSVVELKETSEGSNLPAGGRMGAESGKHLADTHAHKSQPGDREIKLPTEIYRRTPRAMEERGREI